MAALCALLLGLVAATVNAAYLIDARRVLTQPDGTVIPCLASGDEFYHWVHDQDGYVILRDPTTRWWVYAAKADGKLVPTAAVVGRSDPRALGLVPGIKPDNLYDPAEFEFYRTSAEIENAHLRSLGVEPQAPRLGAFNSLTIFVRFADQAEFEQPLSYFEEVFNGSAPGSSSMYAYFKEASYDQTLISSTFYPTPSGGTVVSYQDSHNRSYYMPYDATSNPDGYQDSQRYAREYALVKSAVDAVAAQVPSSLNIDSNSDGKVDSVVVIVRGDEAEWSDLLWGHRTTLGATALINGKQVRDYTFQMEPDARPFVISHEMGHLLGAPDLYRYDSCSLDVNFLPVANWDLMATNILGAPMHSGIYMKSRYFGWLGEIPEITDSGTYTLNPVTSPTNNAYKIKSKNTENEYFVVEYRRKTGIFEFSVPGSGLIVYRINTKTSLIYRGNVCGPPDEVYVYRPGGTLTVNGNWRAAHLSAETGRTAINDTTDPAPFLSDGSPGGLSINSVGSAGDTISFTVDLSGACTPPGSFTLDSPAAGAVLPRTTTSVTLTWSASAYAGSYDLYFGTTADPALYTTVPGTSQKVNVTAGTTYYWKVVASNSCSSVPAPASGTQSFSVEAAPVVVTVLSDTFEGSFPGAGWTLDPAQPTAGWGKSTARAAGGSASAWCAGGGTSPQPAGGPYLPNMRTRMSYGPFSLEGATEATVDFDLWLASESNADYVWWMVSTDGQNYYGFKLAAQIGSWIHNTFNLKNVTAVQALGAPQVWISFLFESNGSTQYEGAYLDNVVITKTLGSSCSVSCSATVPASASVGASVLFQAQASTQGCTGGVTYDWDFGDGAAHAAGQSPSHTYADSGTYTWKLVASSGSATCTKQGTITIGAAGAASYVVPSVAHLPGAAGTKWRSDVAAVNRSAAAAALTLTYAPESGSPQSSTTSLAAGGTVEWQDILVSVFGYGADANTKGTLLIDSSTPLTVTSRTYNQKSATETFGQYYPALTADDALDYDEAGYLLQIKKNAGFRTNVGVVNLAEAAIETVIRLYDATAHQVGSNVRLTVPARRWLQQNDIFAAAGATSSVDIAYAQVRVETPGGKAWFYASVIDATTGDPTTVPVLETTSATLIVPSVAHAPGKGGTQWRTDVATFCPSSAGASLTLEYTELGAASAQSQTDSLVPYGTAEWRDLLVSRFGLASTANSKGTLRLLASEPILATSRTYNEKSATETFGQYYPALAASQGLVAGQTGVLAQIKKNAGFRTNVGAVNLGSAACTVVFRLFGAGGGQLGAAVTLDVPAGQWLQRDDVFAAAGVSASTDIAYATVEVQTAGGRAWAYASVVDNTTGDPTTVPVKR